MYYESLLNKEFKIVSSTITISGTLVLEDGRNAPFIENAEINLIRQDGSVLNYSRKTWFLSWGSSFECFSLLYHGLPKEDFLTLFSDGVPVYTNQDIFEICKKINCMHF